MIGDTTAPSASRAGRNENFLSPILFTVFSGYGKSCSGNRGQTVQIKIQQLKLSLYVLSRGRKTPPNPRSVRWTEKLSTGQPGHLFAVWSGRDDRNNRVEKKVTNAKVTKCRTALLGIQGQAFGGRRRGGAPAGEGGR